MAKVNLRPKHGGPAVGYLMGDSSYTRNNVYDKMLDGKVCHICNKELPGKGTGKLTACKKCKPYEMD